MKQRPPMNGGLFSVIAASVVFFSRRAPVSGLDLDGRTVGHRTPDLFDLLVGERDASVRPVELAMVRASALLPTGQAVQHDVAARLESEGRSTGAMRVVRIGNVER